MSTGNISLKAEITKLFVRHGKTKFITNHVILQFLAPARIQICLKCLTLSVPILDEEKKFTTRERVKIFTLLWGAAKGFTKALKAFIKPFEAPEKSVKIKF